MAAGIGDTEVDVGGLRDIAVTAQVGHRAHITALRGMEDIAGVSTKQLAGSFQKDPLRGGQDAFNGEARVVDTVLARDQVVTHQRALDPGQNMVMHRVDLAEGGAHLTHLRHEAAGQSRESDVAFLQVHAFLAKGNEEVAAGVGIDDRLESDLGLVHLEGGNRLE